MAAADQLQDLREEATCSICLEYFKDPVSIECGHNFCRSCITQCWEGSDPNFPCPQCRETSPGGNLRPSRQLGNMVEMLKKLHIPPVKPQEGNLCEKHEEKLKLFCEEDQKLICLVCRESRDHKSHSALPIEEAAQEYKKTLQIHLEKLQKQLKDLQGWTTEKSRTASELEGKYRSQKERILSAFEELKQFLSRRSNVSNSLEKVQEEEIKRIRGKVTELEKQQSTLKDLITEIEGKCQQQDVQLLQDVRSFLSRSNNVTVQKPKDDSADMKKNLQSFSSQHVYLQEKIKELKETFPAELDLRGRFITCKVTLDPDSAHPELVLSEGRRRVRPADRAQPLPDNPTRFTDYPCVLGSEGFTSGRHYWELQLLQEGGAWYAGVAGESVSRKGAITWSPEGGVWAVRGCKGHYWALPSPPSPLSPREPPGKLGVYLDYEGGRLSLYNADTREHLCTFPRAPFTERVFPFFCLCRGAELRLL